jgi:FMN-dependent NADH-azoreductase
MKLLHIASSILGQSSMSRALSAEVVATQRASHPGIEVTCQDLATDPIDHLTGIHLAALQGALPIGEALQQDIASGQATLEEFLVADVVVVGAPMYNFGIPSQLKAWIDRLAIAGKTFRHTERRPEGLAGDKKVIVASSRGGLYGPGTPAAPMEHQES